MPAAADAPAVVLALDSVSRSFPDGRRRRRRALRDVSLRLEAGQVLGLVGPDGAGKTTLLRLAAGLLLPDTGSVCVLGRDAVEDPIGLRERIGVMPQSFGLYEDLTVRENLALHEDLRGVPLAERRARRELMLETTGLAPFTERLAGRLSGGMKQKLGLACTLVASPAVLLLDEPTAGVDPVSRRDLWRILERLSREEGVGILIATAALDEAARCDRVAVLFDGRIEEEDPPGRLAHRMAGRVYEVECDDEREARRRQAAARTTAGVVDAAIVAGRVRVVLDAASRTPPADLGGLRSVAPRFEDAFMAAAAARSPEAPPAVAPAPGPARRPGAGAPVVRVRDLVKRFGAFTAVNRVSFDVRRGEIFGLLGPNGAGKTTTFRMLCGLLRATDGHIEVAGSDLRRSPAAARARLGYMAQRFSLYGHLSVDENLRFYGRSYGLHGRRLRARLERVHAEFGLEAFRRRAAGSLPGGHRQRLAMAAALLHEPEVLFLDEPTSGVDPLARREFWSRIDAVAAGGMTVIVTTHFMDEAESCDRILIQSRGEPLALGTPSAIRELAWTPDRPRPSIEDAFVALALGEVSPAGTAADPAASALEPTGGTR